jgi:hypothetical protein
LDLEWAIRHGFYRRYHAFLAAWRIEADARQREADERAAGRDDASWQAKGYRGGRCDPHEFSVFDDEVDVTAGRTAHG